jgi:hypothetical protein
MQPRPGFLSSGRTIMTTVKPSLDQMIAEAAKRSPGREAWEPIFEAFPDLTVEELADKFRAAAARDKAEAEELRAYLRQRKMRDATGVVSTKPRP